MAMSVLKQLRNAVGLAALAIGAGVMAAGSPAMAFNLVDGIFQAAEYDASINVPWRKGKDISGTADIFYRLMIPQGDEGNSMLWLYTEAPIEDKNLVWITPKPDNNPPPGPGSIFEPYGKWLSFDDAVKSEKVEFLSTSGIVLTGDLNHRGNTSTTVGTIAEYKDSVDTVLGLTSVPAICTTAFCDATGTTMAFEFKINGTDVQLSGLLASFDELKFHLSPDCKEFECGPEDPPRGPPQAPEPNTLAIFGLGLAALGFMRRRRRAA